MAHKRMGACYYPTTAVLTDDSRVFLDTLSLKLDSDILCRLFVDPKLALKYVAHQSKLNSFNHSCLVTDEEYFGPEVQNLKLCLTDVSAPLANPDRFNEVSVIVLDFSMPHLNGLEFIDKLIEYLGDNPIKIIMVTGEADKNLAVKLFNEGKIHQFILKREPELAKLISDGIRNMQRAYFSDVSSLVLSNLARTTAPCLSDPRFIEKFFEICQGVKATEYYLYENTGSFILVGEDGKINLLIVRMSDDLEMYADMAQDQEIETSLVKQIKEGTVLPFLGTFERLLESSTSEWLANLYPAKHIKGQQDYYYALITHNKHSVLASKKK